MDFVRYIIHQCTLILNSTIILMYTIICYCLEVVENCCNFTSSIMGESLPLVATDMDIHSYREPLGVTAGIAPFNFPAMIPLWMFPVAISCGNTFVIKASR